MGYVEWRSTVGETKGNIEGDIEYIDYLTAEYNGRIRFYLKEEKDNQ